MKKFVIIIVLLISSTAYTKEKIAIIPISTIAGDEVALKSNVNEISNKLHKINNYEVMNIKLIKNKLSEKHLYIEKDLNLDKYLLELLECRDKFLERLEYCTKRVTEIESFLYYNAPYSEQKWDTISKARILLGLFHSAILNNQIAENVHYDLLKTRPKEPFRDYFPTNKETQSLKRAYKRLEKGKTGFLRVESNLKNAVVLAEGRNIGTTPLEAELACGRYHIQIIKENERSIPRIIDPCSPEKYLYRVTNNNLGIFIDMDFDKMINTKLGFGFTFVKNKESNKRVLYLTKRIKELLDLDKIAFISFVQDGGTTFLSARLIDVKSLRISFKGYILSPVEKLPVKTVSSLSQFISTGEFMPPVVDKPITQKPESEKNGIIQKKSDDGFNKKQLSYISFATSSALFVFGSYGLYKVDEYNKEYAKNRSNDAKNNHELWKKLSLTGLLTGSLLAVTGTYLLFNNQSKAAINKSNTAFNFIPSKNEFLFQISWGW